MDATVATRGDVPMTQRRGARRKIDVTIDLLARLHAGEESRTHIEQMCIDQGVLLAALFPDRPEIAQQSHRLTSAGFIANLRAGGAVLLDSYGPEALFEACGRGSARDAASPWRSDTARGWAAFAVGLTGWSVQAQLSAALAFAGDHHFAVREFAWLGVRDAVVEQPREAIEYLTGHVYDPSPRVRRFCSEVTRPRGVWSRHIPTLKNQPDLGLPLLDPLASSGERYVTDSVGNWLNDVARDNPSWAAATCERWRRVHGTKAQATIRHAARNQPRADQR